MADDQVKNDAETGPDDAISVPNLPPSVSLPPPPEIEFTRPTLGQPAPRPASPRSVGASPTQGERPTPERVGAGMSAGIGLASSLLVGFFLGQWIDHRWNHSGTPWGTLVFTLAGAAAGFINLFRLVGISDRTTRKK